MQKFKELTEESKFHGSLDILTDNDKSILSQFSDTKFPEGDFPVGTGCYRTDSGLEYILDKNKEWRKTTSTKRNILDKLSLLIKMDQFGNNGYMVLPTEDNILVQWGKVSPYDAVRRVFYESKSSPTGHAGYFRRINHVKFPIPYISRPLVKTNDPFKSGNFDSAVVSYGYPESEMVVHAYEDSFMYDIYIRGEKNNTEVDCYFPWRAGKLVQACPENYSTRLMGCDLSWIAIGAFDFSAAINILENNA